MGIERFYKFITSDSTFNKNAIVLDLDSVKDVDFLFIDFNSIVYRIAEIIEDDINTLFHMFVFMLNDDKLYGDKEMIKGICKS